MSKNITISEGENARVFGNTKKLKTLLQGEDAGSCFWVPEDETQVNPTYIMENGLHTAAEAGEYGFSVAHVNVPGKVTDLDGIDWDITIDEDGIPHIEIDDSDIEITIDDETSEIEVTIDEEPVVIDPKELDLDPDEDIDISFDPEDMDVDIVGTDLDGDDVVIDLDPITGDFDTFGCPASIQVMHVPNKTEYTDGWAIDYDGLVVQAFDADGNPWSSPDYPDGYIPVNRLNLPQYADAGGETGESYVYADGVPYICLSCTAHESGVYFEPYQPYRGPVVDTKNLGPLTMDETWVGYAARKTPGDIYLTQYNGTVYTKTKDGVWATVVYCKDGDTSKGRGTNPFEINMAIGYPESPVNPEGRSLDNIIVVGAVQTVVASWESPCFETLTASFDISVNPKQDHGGSHHSGKF